MRSLLSLLLLLTLLLAAVPATGLPDETGAGQRPTPEEALRANRELLAQWRADPDHNARLQRDLRAFRALPEERRARLRTLDRELHRLDSTTRERLWRVLERYRAWRERLSEKERRHLDSASDWHERLRLIKELREQQWIRRQPERVRESLKGLSPAQRSRRVAELRTEQQQRYHQALAPFRSRQDQRRPTRLEEFPVEVQLFVRRSLWPLLTHAERRQLKAAEGTPGANYARTLARLAKKHPLPLPGPIGPVRIADLPSSLRERVRKHPRWEANLKKNEGKWPEFGVALLRPRGKKKSPFLARVPGMPSRPGDFSFALREFITTGPLGQKMTPSEKQELKKAEGKWPDYPKTLLRLARKHKLTLPGMKLPGPKELWDRVRR